MAQKLVERCLEGDIAALREIGDRLDGKPTQAVEYSGEEQIIRIVRVIVDTKSAPAYAASLVCSALIMCPVSAYETDSGY